MWAISGPAGHNPGPRSGDDLGEMAAIYDDVTVEALLAGEPTADDALAPLVPVIGALRARAAAEPVPVMGAELRAQLAKDAVVVPLVPRRAVRSLVAKGAAAAAIVSVGLVGVAAAQNRLPADLQDVVSSTAGIVGIDVPSAGERGHVDHTQLERGRYEDGTTPGGATPADPGTPGDKEPATPATPPVSTGTSLDSPAVTAGPPESVPADEADDEADEHKPDDVPDNGKP